MFFPTESREDWAERGPIILQKKMSFIHSTANYCLPPMLALGMKRQNSHHLRHIAEKLLARDHTAWTQEPRSPTSKFWLPGLQPCWLVYAWLFPGSILVPARQGPRSTHNSESQHERCTAAFHTNSPKHRCHILLAQFKETPSRALDSEGCKVMGLGKRKFAFQLLLKIIFVSFTDIGKGLER